MKVLIDAGLIAFRQAEIKALDVVSHACTARKQNKYNTAANLFNTV